MRFLWKVLAAFASSQSEAWNKDNHVADRVPIGLLQAMEDNLMTLLFDMGYTIEEVSSAMGSCLHPIHSSPHVCCGPWALVSSCDD